MINVVMNGWSPRMETNAPLMQPIPRPMSSAKKIAAQTLTPEVSICMTAAPATAMTEPTDRSMPAVEITKVMPVAIMRYRADSCSMVISGPARPPVFLFQLRLRNWWSEIVQIMMSTISATTDHVRFDDSSFLTTESCSCFAFLSAIMPPFLN